MRIESIIRRQAGSSVTLGDKTYRFAAGDDGRHVCEVEDPTHVERLLSIKEAFREVDPVPVEKIDGDTKAMKQPRKPKQADPDPVEKIEE